MVERVVYLKKLKDDIQVTYHESYGRFLVENSLRHGVFLCTTPKLKWSITKGVHLIDKDPTGEFCDDVLYTANSYTRLRKGSTP